MSWQPTTRELLLIADFGTGGMPSAKLAEAIGITEDEFRAWSASLVATRSAPRAAPPMVATGGPAFKGHRPDRVLADRLFERPPELAAVQDCADDEDRGEA
jgi:hypothetical protein